MERTWSSEHLELAAYLDRIGLASRTRPEPTLAGLRELHRAHTLSVPFENLEVILGRGVRLDPASLQDKLVRRRRGGYCFEHTSLFAAVLEELGFGVTALTGRIRMGADRVLPATHAVLRVETQDAPGRAWLADVGFGAGPLTPLELADGAEESAGDWHYLLRRQEVTPGPGGGAGVEGWVLHAWDAGKGRWADRHGFTMLPQYPVDYEVGSHFIATHPRSPFTARTYVQRVLDDGLYVLDGTQLTFTRPADGSVRTRELRPREVPGALTDLFGIRLTASDSRALIARSARDSG